MSEGINFEAATFKIFYICLSLLILKMFFMVPLTARQRFLKKVVMNPEDTKLKKGLKVKFNDPDVERVRRAHLNDLENILPFISVSFLYISLKPSPYIAVPLVIAYTIARYAHTYVYAVKVVKQPARFICYAVGYLITGYMASYVALTLKDNM